MQVFWYQFAVAVMLCAAVVVGTTAFHYEALRWLAPGSRQKRAGRASVPVTLFLLICVHLVEIGAYAFVYAAATEVFGVGGFAGAREMRPLDYFYYAAETYSSLGYGDIFPIGELRLIASISPLNGILLLAWSGSFLFALVQHSHSLETDETDGGKA